MRIIRRLLCGLAAALLMDGGFLWHLLPMRTPGKIGCLALLATVFLLNALHPTRGKGLPRKLRQLAGGCELLAEAGVAAVLQLAIYVCIGLGIPRTFGAGVWIVNAVVGLLLMAALLVSALARLFIASGQLTAGDRLFLLFLWWMPLVNLVVFFRIYQRTSAEYALGLRRLLRNRERVEQTVCRTKYPLLLVHGIFFRDWKLLGYWGRIPQELMDNGAAIHYGNQESSASVERSAEELAARITQIVEREGCEKVNIIAHSKGGLDARYALSRLGMDQYVASLTTVNTPHRGCRFARKALDKLPKNLVSSLSKRYDAIFAKLGDDEPDFFSGVSELTDEKCAELNDLLPDCEGVLYQSVGSYMKNKKSAGFPLNLGYSIAHTIDGANDGLVAVPSMPWGEFTLLEPVGRRGISHGDVIDLTRKDVPGFDVCEFYVQLVQSLKERGL